MPLQTIHRPDTFTKFIGNTEAVEALDIAVNREDFPHSFLFTGIAGCGKTTLAWIMKKHFNCADMDYYYYNAANTRGIDTIRDISVNCHLAPMGGPKKIYVLDEFHQVTGAATEAMLLLLENPPKDTLFILCTSEPEKLKLSIKRRCFQCNLKPVTDKEALKILNQILTVEKVDDMPPAVLQEIAKSCQGSAGMAVALLDAVIDIEDEKTQLSVIDGMRGVNDAEGIDICRALSKKSWKDVAPLLSAFNGEPEALRYLILSYFSKILLSNNKRSHGQALEVIMTFSESFMYSKKAGLISCCYIACN
jgi:DNA polymerase-3 subunit gamma/tau